MTSMTRYEALEMLQKDSEKAFQNYREECRFFVDLFREKLRLELGWPESQFQYRTPSDEVTRKVRLERYGYFDWGGFHTTLQVILLEGPYQEYDLTFRQSSEPGAYDVKMAGKVAGVANYLLRKEDLSNIPDIVIRIERDLLDLVDQYTLTSLTGFHRK